MSKPAAVKPGHVVGIEFDHLAIRAVRLSRDGLGGHSVDALVDATGNFAEDAELLEGLRQVKDQLKLGSRDLIATCLSGRQVSVNEITFRALPAEEMESALRIEMRKSTPFDTAGSTLDYQVLENRDAKTETNQVLVAMAGAGLLTRHLGLLEKAGLTPTVVDLLPVAAGNALWSWVGAPKSDSPHVAVHIGPQICTVVIDGARSPFFNRYVYLAAEDFPGKEPGSPEVDRMLRTLSDEVARSLAFYEKSASAAGFQKVLLLGEFLDTPGLADHLRRHTGLAVQKLDLPRKLGWAKDQPAGRFDLATALALRAGDE